MKSAHPWPALRAPLSGVLLALACTSVAATSFGARAADAADHWVSASAPAGATWAGSVSAASPASLDTANARAEAADRVHLLPGDYGGRPVAPVRAGTAGARIVFRGDPADTAAVHGIGDVFLQVPFVTVEFLSGAGTISIRPGANDDSVHACAYSAAGGVSIDGDRFTLSASRISGGVLHTCYDCGNAYPDPSHAFVFSPRITDNVLDLHGSQDNLHVIKLLYTRFARFERNRAELTVDPQAVNTNGLTAYFSPGITSRDNRWTIRVLGGPGCDAAVILRDSTYGCLFERDSILVPAGSVPGHADVRFAADGSLGVPHNTGRNRFEHLFVVNYDTEAVHYQDMPWRDTVQFCVFASGTGTAVIFNDDAQAITGPERLVFRHNTLFGNFSQVATFKTQVGDTTSVYRSNILYTPYAPQCVSWAAMARLGEISAAQADSNLYYSPGAAADSTAATQIEGGICASPSAFAAASAWGSPCFADSAWYGFDPTPASGSWAVNSRWADGFVGALPGPPWPVRDLAAVRTGNTTTVLTWTEPQRVKAAGAVWQVRRSADPMRTDAEFQRGTLVAAGSCLNAGFPECVTVTKLTPCTTYQFAVRVQDEYGRSFVGNLAPVTTACGFAGEVECTLERAGAPPPDGAGRSITGGTLLRPGEGARLGVRFAAEDAGRPWRFELFDLLGRRVATLGSGVVRGAGDGADVPLPDLRAGVVWARLAVGDAVVRRAFVVVP